MAKRALAYKWLRIIYRCWKTGQVLQHGHGLGMGAWGQTWDSGLTSEPKPESRV